MKASADITPIIIWDTHRHRRFIITMMNLLMIMVTATGTITTWTWKTPAARDCWQPWC